MQTLHYRQRRDVDQGRGCSHEKRPQVDPGHASRISHPDRAGTTKQRPQSHEPRRTDLLLPATRDEHEDTDRGENKEKRLPSCCSADPERLLPVETHYSRKAENERSGPEDRNATRQDREPPPWPILHRVS